MRIETLGVDAAALRGFGTDLVIAAGDIPTAPAPFTVTGADAISQKISSLLPEIEGPILAGLPQVKGEAENTANRVVGAADTYLRVDDELAGNIRRAAGLVNGSGVGSASGGSGSGGSGSSGSGGGASSASSSASGGAGSPATGGSSGTSGASSQMGQLMSTAMQAAQLPVQAMGALAAMPQAAMQAVQQVTEMAGGKDGGPDEAAAGHPGAERAPVEPPVAERDSAMPQPQPRPSDPARDV